MILFQLSQWMEERKRLVITIQENRGDIQSLIYKKEQVEEKLLTQARKWLISESALPHAHSAFDLDLEDSLQLEESGAR